MSTDIVMLHGANEGACGCRLLPDVLLDVRPSGRHYRRHNSGQMPGACLVGAEDRIVSPQTARTTADGYPGATFRELQGHGHMLVLEPGAENIARRIADWIEG